MRHSRRNRLRREATAVALIALAALAPAGAARAQESYLAVGDSWAFGYTTAAGTPVNAGDNGYVSLFANFLDAQNGAAPRPTVISTARPGEDFTTFGSFASGTGGPNNNGFYNTNYQAPPSPTQQTLLQGILTNPAVAPTIKNVTVQLGGNNLLGLFAQPSWYAATDPQRQAAIVSTVNAVQSGMTTLLQQIRTALPGANIYVLGYADLFRAIPDSTLITAVQPLLPGATYGTYVKPYTAQANGLSDSAYSAAVAAALSGVSGSGAVRYVPLTSTFLNNETTLSLIGQDTEAGTRNFHPNAAGYQAIGDRLAVAAAVPEAGTLPLVAAGLGLGCAAVAVARRRHKTASVPAL